MTDGRVTYVEKAT